MGNFSLFLIPKDLTCICEMCCFCAQMWSLDASPFKFVLKFYKAPIDQLLD